MNLQFFFTLKLIENVYNVLTMCKCEMALYIGNATVMVCLCISVMCHILETLTCDDLPENKFPKLSKKKSFNKKLSPRYGMNISVYHHRGTVVITKNNTYWVAEYNKRKTRTQFKITRETLTVSR